MLLEALDDDRNDIYLHVDKKVKKFPEEVLKNTVLKANLIFVPRKSISWGGYSQIEVELLLLETATKTQHCYYHLLSGVDFPLKTQDEIYDFFNKNRGKNFIKYDWKSIENKSHLDRIKFYHFFQEKIGRNSGKTAAFWWKMENVLLKGQKRISVDRIKGEEDKILKGTQWFSITHEMADYIIDKIVYIKRKFSYSLCADEVFLQTVASASPYKESIVDDSLRLIDWKRGDPYIFRSDDYDILSKSSKLFARKFDEDVDIEIVRRLLENLKDESNPS